MFLLLLCMSHQLVQKDEKSSQGEKWILQWGDDFLSAWLTFRTYAVVPSSDIIVSFSQNIGIGISSSKSWTLAACLASAKIYLKKIKNFKRFSLSNLESLGIVNNWTWGRSWPHRKHAPRRRVLLCGNNRKFNFSFWGPPVARPSNFEKLRPTKSVVLRLSPTQIDMVIIEKPSTLHILVAS